MNLNSPNNQSSPSFDVSFNQSAQRQQQVSKVEDFLATESQKQYQVTQQVEKEQTHFKSVKEIEAVKESPAHERLQSIETPKFNKKKQVEICE